MMRKAVSPIVATVLLIIIAVAAGVLIWVWLHGFASKNPTAQPALNQRIEIDAVKVVKGTTGDNITVYVRNIGSVPVNITAVYVLDYNGNVVKGNTSINVQVLPEQSVTLVKAITFAPLKSGYQYAVKVVTADGIETTHTFIAP